MISVVPYQYREPVTGMLGAGTGLVVSELPAEYAARVAGLAGWYKFAAKALVKVVIAAIIFAISNRTYSAGWKLFSKVAAYAGLGSIIPDAITAYYPGGIPGLAERLATMSRMYQTGAVSVSSQMGMIERMQRAGATQVVPSSVGSIGTYR